MTVVLEPAVSIASARRALAARFRERGLDSPELDARVLVAHALGVDHPALIRQSSRILREAEIDRIAVLAARRLGGEPVARILGMKEFWSLPFMVTPAVLVPRPETETLVEAALQVLQARAAGPVRIADLGTGSGALLLALLHECVSAQGVGTDLSSAAVEVARENARRLGLSSRATFVTCDFGAALGAGFDLIVSNPPYVADREWARLDPEVRNHDPKLALHGGEDGLAAYRRIAADVRRLAVPGAHILVELGVGRADAVAAIFRAAGLVIRGTHPDLNGMARALILAFEP